MTTALKTGVRLALASCVAGLHVAAFAQVLLQRPIESGSAYRTVLLKTPAAPLQVQALSALQVEQAWVRPTVPGQHGTGGYMKLTARETVRLVGVSSPLAGVAEVHEMKMDGGVMTMRPVKTLELPAGKTVELKPGGVHLMLMDLKQAVPAGSSVPVTLVLQDSRGVESRINTRLLASPAQPGGGAHDGHRK